MSELSMLKILELWDEAVSLIERGLYEDALMKFMSLEQMTADNQSLITSARNLFNIGQTYFSLGRLDMAIKAFQESIAKDKMFAIAHFMLGCAHIKRNLNQEALQDFENAYFFLRGNRVIDYKQLGLKYKLYSCEILCNRAIAYANLGKDHLAQGDFLKAVESRVEPRHGVIQDALLCWQRGKKVEPITIPSIVFRPSKSNMKATGKKIDYKGKSQVVAARIEDTEKNEGDARVKLNGESEAHRPDAMNLLSERSKLMKDIGKKETRRSLKKTSGSPASSKLRSDSPTIPPPRPTSPYPVRKPVINSGRVELGTPPSKPLPPPPRSKSPLPIPRRPVPPSPAPEISIPPEPVSPVRPPKRHGKPVTFELVITRTIQVNQDCTVGQMSQAAAKALGVSEDMFSMWYNRDDELTHLDQNTLPLLWKSDSKPKVYCREKK